MSGIFCFCLFTYKISNSNTFFLPTNVKVVFQNIIKNEVTFMNKSFFI